MKTLPHTPILLIALLVTSTTIVAQNIENLTIEWNCTSTFVAMPGTSTDEISKVVSSSEKITWYDQNGVAKETLDVTGTTGSWSNVSSNGMIYFNVVSGDNNGMVEFIKSDGTTRIRIHIVRGTEPQVYELTVDNLHVL